MRSKAATVEQYLQSLPDDRRAALAEVRDVILKNLDRDYEEGMQCGMIGYYVPHRVFPVGYHCDPRQPLLFAALASQKNHMSLYLMTLYGSRDQLHKFKQAWSKAGKKLDMGKSCLRFKTVDDLALDVIGEAIRRVPARKYVEYCQAALESHRRRRAAAKTPPAKPRTAKPPSKPARTAKKRPRDAKPRTDASYSEA
jgi:hypothetical protein